MIKKRAYIFVNLEISSWPMFHTHRRGDVQGIINRTVNVLKGSQSNQLESTTTYDTRLIEAVRTILYLTEIPTEDMIEVLEKFRDDILYLY